MNLDYNSEYDVIAFSTGKNRIIPKVFLYYYQIDETFEIYSDSSSYWDELREIRWSPDYERLVFTIYSFVNNPPAMHFFDIKNMKLRDFSNMTRYAIDIQWLSNDTLAYVAQANIYGFDVIGAITNIVENESKSVKKINLSVYPNPFNDQVHIKISSQLIEPLMMNIYDIKGQLILSKTFNSNKKEYNHFWTGENNEGIKVGSGIYLLRISSSNNLYRSITKKLLLLK